MKNESNSLDNFVSLKVMVDQFNKKYQGIFPKLTRKKALAKLRQNDVTVFQYGDSTLSQPKLYVDKSVDLAQYFASELRPFEDPFDSDAE